MPRWDRRNLETFFVKGRSIQGRRTLAHSAISEEKSEAGFLNTKAKCQHFKHVSRQKRSAGKPGIGSSIKLKTKCKKKWRWSCGLMKTWLTYNNNIMNLFAKKLIQNVHFYSKYGISYVWYPWFWWQANILKICTGIVLCFSIPLQKLFLLQAFHMMLKCPLNNFFWMTLTVAKKKAESSTVA